MFRTLIISAFLISCSAPAPVNDPAPNPKKASAPITLTPPNPVICKLQDEFNVPMEKYDEMTREQQDLILGPDRQKSEDYLAKTYNQLYVFREKNGNQIMALYPCCDQPTGMVFLFRNGQVPAYVIEWYKGENYGDLRLETDEDVKTLIAKRTNYGKEMDKSYFVSKKGVKLGMSSSEAVKLYGPPLSKNVIDKNRKITRYIWENYGRVELEGYIGAHVKDGYLYAKMDQPPDKYTKVGVFCPDIPQGVTIYIDFQPTADGDEAIFIYMDHHSIG